jgi:hypothetical protein
MNVMTEDKLQIDIITKEFFSVFNNCNGKQIDWSILYRLCIPEIIIIKKEEPTEVVYNLESFIRPRMIILSDGTLTEFTEEEKENETKIVGNIAQRFSKYTKGGFLNGASFEQSGTKSFEFVNTSKGWKISHLIWEDDRVS